MNKRMWFFLTVPLIGEGQQGLSRMPKIDPSIIPTIAAMSVPRSHTVSYPMRWQSFATKVDHVAFLLLFREGFASVTHVRVLPMEVYLESTLKKAKSHTHLCSYATIKGLHASSYHWLLVMKIQCLTLIV